MNRKSLKWPKHCSSSRVLSRQSPLIQRIIKQFCPRFTPGSTVLCLGDEAANRACCDKAALLSIGVEAKSLDALPNVVLHQTATNRLILIEAVPPHGPVDSMRRTELKQLFQGSGSELVFITAFLDRSSLPKYFDVIDWGTVVWVSKTPARLIHLGAARVLQRVAS